MVLLHILMHDGFTEPISGLHTFYIVQREVNEIVCYIVGLGTYSLEITKDHVITLTLMYGNDLVNWSLSVIFLSERKDTVF